MGQTTIILKNEMSFASQLYNAPQRSNDRLQRIINSNQRSALRWSAVRGPYNANQYSGEFEFDVEAKVDSIDSFMLATMYTDLESLFDRMIDYVRVRQTLHANDRMQMVIGSNFFVWTKLLPLSMITGASFLSLIENAMDSNQDLELTGAIVTIKYYVQQRPRGRGCLSSSAEEFVRKKKSICQIWSNRICFWVGVAFGVHEHKDVGRFKKMRKYGQRGNEVQEREGEEVRALCGLGETITYDQIPIVEAKLECSIMIVDYEGMTIRYSSKTYEPLICLLLIPEGEGHFHYVKKDYIGQLWVRSRFCRQCNKAYANDGHKCIRKCMACKTAKCDGKEVTSWSLFRKECGECKCKFYDDACFNLHKKKMCSKYAKCEDCSYLYDREEKHVCGHRKCNNCKQQVSVDQSHECYHQQLGEDELPPKSDRYMFYDYETYVGANSVHVTAAIVVMFSTSETVKRFFSTEEFVTFLLQEDHKGFTCIAHNSGRYDFHFIKQELLRRGVTTSDVCNGNTIFYSMVPDYKIRFVDSYRLIPIPLRAFPKSFGLKEVAKGYFPYRFLNENTRTYIGPIPGLEWFDFDSMKPGDRKDALAWHKSMEGKEVHLMDMCWEYCESDVLLLKEGCLKFRELFLELTGGGVDPLQCITIASVCMTIYRAYHLPERTIGVIEGVSEEVEYHEDMFTLLQQQGVIASHIVYKVCVNNGCTKCFHPYTKHPKTGLMMKDLFYQCIRDSEGRTLLWEHEFVKRYKNYFTEESRIQFERERINMRDAFYGGRTEPIQLYRRCRETEKIRYFDYTSLYPSVQFGKVRGVTQWTYMVKKILNYPCGHPRRIKNVAPQDLHRYFGFVKCDITPPADLHIPVLPEKKYGKLMFDLTRKEAGTWCINEVLVAMKKGYVITKIYEVLHFDHIQDDLFRDYVAKFLRMKIIATGRQGLHLKTEEEVDTFCRILSREFYIELKVEDIPLEKNPGLYLISKLCLNSLWGKFGQRDSFTNTVDVFSWNEFQKVIEQDDIDVMGVILHGSKARTITYQTKKEFLSVPKYTNIAIAAFTTAHARCRLYEVLDNIPSEDILYMDTDSVLFVEHENRCPVTTGNFLGDLTDECEEGEYITEYVSIGPKSYAYRTNKGKEEVKVKGITLSHNTKKKIDFDCMMEMTVNPSHQVKTQALQFLIHKDHTIATKQFQENEGKIVRCTMNKRKVAYDDATDFSLPTRPFKKNK